MSGAPKRIQAAATRWTVGHGPDIDWQKGQWSVKTKMDVSQEYARADIADDMLEASPRAIEMLRVAAAFMRQQDPNGLFYYDEADCDGYCIADDCESAAGILEGACAKARGCGA